ncbi:MAG: hypothetical protein JWP00_1026 [Chloroflexi bacterium]|nr:hypothetical protein [Chloroflexota bacterium]
MTELKRKPEVDYYKILQVDTEAESEVIDAAYRALSKKYHPDINRASDAEDRMAQINSAYNVLSDASKRRDYNYLRKGLNPAISHTPNRPRPTSATPYSSPVANRTGPGAPTGSSSFNPSAANRTSKPPTPGPVRPASAAGNPANSFRTQEPPARNSGPAPKVAPEPHIASRTGLNFAQKAKSRTALYMVGFFVFALVAIGVVLLLELLAGNPFKTSFVSQPAATVAPVVSNQNQGKAPPAAPTPTTSTQAGPASRDQVFALLNSADLYQGRIGDLGLSTPDVLQLKMRLAPNGMALNSETAPANRTPDELDNLRHSELTAYNLVYTIFARFPDINRINLTLTDNGNRPVYRADVPRTTAYNFYGWHTNQVASDPAEVIKTAKQDHQFAHFGTTLDETVRARLNSPTDANLQAELQSIGLSAFTVTSSPQLTVNYFQVRSQAEMAVDFSRIFYTLYTRFPAIDKAQIIVSSLQERPIKAIDRQLFNQLGLEAWSLASYGGPTVGGDRQAQTLIAGLPGNLNDLKGPAITVQSKYKTPIQVGSWAVVAENVERYDALALEGLKFPAGKDRQYLVVRVALKNGTDGRQWLFPGDRLALLDTKGDKYSPDASATLLYVLKTPPATDPPPGPIEATKQGAIYVVFNIPAGTNLTTLRLQYSDGDKRALLELA